MCRLRRHPRPVLADPVQLDVPARGVGAHRRQHAVPVRLRDPRRALDGRPSLPRLLPYMWSWRKCARDRNLSGVESARSWRERRHLRSPGRVLAVVPGEPRADADPTRDPLLGGASAGLDLHRPVVPAAAVQRPRFDQRCDRGRRRLLGPHRRLRHWPAAGPHLCAVGSGQPAAGLSPDMTGATATVFVTTFLGSAVEAIEMVAIVVGVGATRGWRSTWFGVMAGLAVLVAVVVLFGLALGSVPIGPLRLVIGVLLPVFGLQWLRKGIKRVAARRLTGMGIPAVTDSERWVGPGVDWTAFVLALKGVLLEGVEIAFIVVSVGLAAREVTAAIVGGALALVLTAAAGTAFAAMFNRFPRSVLQLVVGILLTTFGTFWSLEGLGVEWPSGDLSILPLLAFYAVVALSYTRIERRRMVAG